jgi:hypothetical protein
MAMDTAKSAGTNNGGKGKLPKPNNIITIPIAKDYDFFHWWCVFLRPVINLTNREIDVIASFLKQRWELSKSISDQAILDEMVMSDATKRKVMDECGISLQHFYVVMSNLRKSKIIEKGKINPRLIPNIRQDSDNYFQLMILFKKQ